MQNHIHVKILKLALQFIKTISLLSNWEKIKSRYGYFVELKICKTKVHATP